MRALRWSLVTIATLTVMGGRAFCQSEEDIELNLFRPRLEISADTFPNRSFETTNGEYGSHSGRLNVNIPLGSTHLRPQKGILAYQFMAQANFSGASPDITFLSQDHRLYTGALAFTSVMLSRSKNLYVASVGATAAEDEETIGSPTGRFFGAGLVAHRLGKKTTLIYGGAFTYVFGRGLPLPIIGAIWRLNPKWNLTAMAPFNFVAHYRATDKVSMRIRTGAAGNRFRFSNQGDFPGEPETLYLHVSQWRTTGEVEWRMSDDVALLAQAGTTRTTRFDLSADARGSDPFIEDKTGSAPYARVAARFWFGKTVLEQWQEK